MTAIQNIAVPLWIFILSVIIKITWDSPGILDNFFEKYSARVKRANANIGLDRGKDESQLLLDFLIPFRDEVMSDYLDGYDLSINSYHRHLLDEIGRPYLLILYFLIHILTIFAALSGILIYWISGFTFAYEYLGILIVLLIVDIILYLYNK